MINIVELIKDKYYYQEIILVHVLVKVVTNGMIQHKDVSLDVETTKDKLPQKSLEHHYK